MKNYLCINGKKTELTKEQIKQLGIVVEQEISISKDKKTAKIGEYEFIVLEYVKNGECKLLLKKSLGNSVFGDTNDYKTSNVRKIVENFGKEIEYIVGQENLVEHTVDLTADDGLKCYGEIKAKCSLLTANMYRKYVYIIDEHKLNSLYWLATAYSTPKHDDSEWIKCVSPGAVIFNRFGYYSACGVHPFCILKSNIFVSK